MVQLLRVARREGFAVGAFNAVDSHFVDAVFAAAGRLAAPVILNVAEVHLGYVQLEDIAAYVRHKARASDLPVALNLDHGLTVATIERAVAAGFTSVMFDGSSLTFDENIRRTAEVVGICRAKGVTVEGELGAVGGDEGGGLEGSADRSRFTDPVLAADFVARTGIDALAVAIGNAHGRYKGTPQLDFDLLRRLGEGVAVPLVLHGGSGLSADDFRRAIGLGIAKVNFYTGMSQAALAALAGGLADAALGGKYDHYPLTMQRVGVAVSAAVAEQIELFGAKGKAAACHG
jgi:fructose-bisphosphate aldolase class II